MSKRRVSVRPADGTGDWSCNPPNFSDGSYVVNAQQATGGNVSDATNTTYIIDRTHLHPVGSLRLTTATSRPINIADERHDAHDFRWRRHSRAVCDGPRVGFELRLQSPCAPQWRCFRLVVRRRGREFRRRLGVHRGPMSVGNFWEFSVWATDLAGNIERESRRRVRDRDPAARCARRQQPDAGFRRALAVHRERHASTTSRSRSMSGGRGRLLRWRSLPRRGGRLLVRTLPVAGSAHPRVHSPTTSTAPARRPPRCLLVAPAHHRLSVARSSTDQRAPTS